MTVTQLAQIKRWMVSHRCHHPVELQVWNLVLFCWLIGWMGLPGTVLTEQWWCLPLCLGASTMPGSYTRYRLRLHRRGRLRCDWIHAVRP